MRRYGVANMTYRVKIKKGESEIEVEGEDKQWVEDKIKELMSEKAYAPIPAEPTPQGMPNTLVEFLETKGNPQKHTALIAVFAYWLLKAEKMEAFNVKDIVSCYDKTRRAKPSNPNQIVNSNVKYNLFAQTSEKKDGYIAWFLTHTGERFVENMK